MFLSSVSGGATLLLAILACQPLTAAQPKYIRLRSGTITNPPAASVAALSQARASQAPVSGLFLVQFEGPVGPAQRAELQARGVRLLQYVPDDAYITRFNHVSVGQLQALSQVRWVGSYRP